MARCGLAFDQRNASSLPGERDRSGTTCHSTTENENFVLQPYPIQIGRSNWNLLFRIRYAGIVPFLMGIASPMLQLDLGAV